VPRHIARLVTRFVDDFFDYAARPDASANRAARRQLLLRRRASGCLGTSCSSSRRSLSTSSPTSRVRMPRHVTQLIVDYFASLNCLNLVLSQRKSNKKSPLNFMSCVLLIFIHSFVYL
jgi:hypothetical protein